MESSTEQKVINAARRVFHRRGYDGARMQEIADEARINKAMLNYYFRTKDQLFEAVYADRAVTQACIGCHNAHPNSPKRDFTMNDVMGGIVISIPLGQKASGETTR